MYTSFKTGRPPQTDSESHIVITNTKSSTKMGMKFEQKCFTIDNKLMSLGYFKQVIIISTRMTASVNDSFSRLGSEIEMV